MAEKRALDREALAKLSIEELNEVAGGLSLKDLTPEEKAKMRQLYDEFYNKKMSGSPASEEFRRYMDYVDELERKYDPEYNNGKW